MCDDECEGWRRVTMWRLGRHREPDLQVVQQVVLRALLRSYTDSGGVGVGE